MIKTVEKRSFIKEAYIYFIVLSPAQTKRRNQTELNCAVKSLGVRGFATSLRRSRTVSYEIQISNRSSVASLCVHGLATGSQQVVQ